MTSLHPLAEDFLALVARDGGALARAKRQAFLRLVEAFGDEGGLPTPGGLRRLESGSAGADLEPGWREVFLDVYRQWLGFRLDQQFFRPPPPFSLRWWWTAPAVVRGLVPSPIARLFAPILALVVALLLVGVLALRPAWVRHDRRADLEQALILLDEAQGRLAAAEEEALERLRTPSPAALEAHLGSQASTESLAELVHRRRAEVAETAGLKER